MQNAVALFVLAVAVSGCSEDKKQDAPPSAPAGSAKASASGTGSAAKPVAPAAGGGITCDQVLPQGFRDKYFKDAKVTARPQVDDTSANCEIDDGSPAGISVSVSCHDNVAAAMQMTIDGIKENMKGTDLAGVGKGAVVVSMGEAGSMVSAWDDDSNCQATLAIPSAVDAAAFAKDFLAVLPVK